MSRGLSLEGKVRVLKLSKVDGLTPEEIVEDLAQSFGFTCKDEPAYFLKKIENSIMKMLHKSKARKKQRLVKLLIQSGLIGLSE